MAMANTLRVLNQQSHVCETTCILVNPGRPSLARIKASLLTDPIDYHHYSPSRKPMAKSRITATRYNSIVHHHRICRSNSNRLKVRRRHKMYHSGTQHLSRNSARIIDINSLKSKRQVILPHLLSTSVYLRPTTP
jgi:hypothetical protein